MLKGLIFVQDLTLDKDTEIHSHILTKLKQDPKLTLKKLAEEYQRILNWRHDTAKIQERDISQVQTAQPKEGKKWKKWLPQTHLTVT